jgi:hypothetical protein
VQLSFSQAPAVDSQAPETEITKPPKRKSAKRKVRIEFGANETGATFECKLDKGDLSPCDSPFKAKVKPGKHVFAVRATDASGNVDATPAQARFKVKR